MRKTSVVGLVAALAAAGCLGTAPTSGHAAAGDPAAAAPATATAPPVHSSTASPAPTGEPGPASAPAGPPAGPPARAQPPPPAFEPALLGCSGATFDYPEPVARAQALMPPGYAPNTLGGPGTPVSNVVVDLGSCASVVADNATVFRQVSFLAILIDASPPHPPANGSSDQVVVDWMWSDPAVNASYAEHGWLGHAATVTLDPGPAGGLLRGSGSDALAQVTLAQPMVRSPAGAIASHRTLHFFDGHRVASFTMLANRTLYESTAGLATLGGLAAPAAAAPDALPVLGQPMAEQLVVDWEAHG